MQRVANAHELYSLITSMAKKLHASKKVLFITFTVFLALLTLELGLRVVESVRDYYFSRQDELRHYSPFVVYTNPQKVFEVQTIQGTDYYIRTAYHPFIAHNIRFPVHKDARTLRVFCLGGSAAMGWPHDLTMSYPAFLEKKLQLLLPARKVEVINVAASTYASYRVKVVFDEIIRYQPDLVLIYSGNNEFLENILYPEDHRLGRPWRHSAIVRTIHQAVSRLREKKQVIDIEHYQPTFLTDIALGNTSPLKLSPAQFRQVVAHYQYSLETMVEAAQSQEVPVMLLTVPVNVQDWQPHASVHQASLDSGELAAWQNSYRQGLAAFREQAYDVAIRHFIQALAVDDQYAELHYYIGQAYLGQAHLEEGKIPPARRHLTQSLEADAYPFRALPEFNAILQTTSRRRNVSLVDIAQVFSSQSPYGMVGSTVLVDHVHPTVASNQRIADAVLLAMRDAGFLKGAKAFSLADVALPVPAHAEATLPLMQHLFLIYRVLLQFDKMDDLYQRCQDLPQYEKNLPAYEPFMEKFDRYLAVMRPYQQLLLAQKTGQQYEQFDQEEVLRIVNDYIEINQLEPLSGM